MKLLKPLHEAVALFCSVAVCPVGIKATGVPLFDAFEISRKRCMADRYLSRSWGDKPFDSSEEDIHAAPLKPDWPPKRDFRSRPASAQYHPHSLTR